MFILHDSLLFSVPSIKHAPQLLLFLSLAMIIIDSNVHYLLGNYFLLLYFCGYQFLCLFTVTGLR